MSIEKTEKQIDNIRLRSTKVRFEQQIVFTTPLLTEASKHRNTKQFTKKKPRCQNASTKHLFNDAPAGDRFSSTVDVTN